MSVQITEFNSLVGDAAIADLSAAATAVTDAIARVEIEHPGYRHSNPTEIRCSAWACSQFMDIKVGPGHQGSAEAAYAAHRTAQVDALLAISRPAPADLGN